MLDQDKSRSTVGKVRSRLFHLLWLKMITTLLFTTPHYYLCAIIKSVEEDALRFCLRSDKFAHTNLHWYSCCSSRRFTALISFFTVVCRSILQAAMSFHTSINYIGSLAAKKMIRYNSLATNMSCCAALSCCVVGFLLILLSGHFSVRNFVFLRHRSCFGSFLYRDISS